jgi:hypothetical protein
MNTETLNKLNVAIVATANGEITAVHDRETDRGYTISHGQLGVRAHPIRGDWSQIDYDFLHMLRGATPKNVAMCGKRNLRDYCTDAYLRCEIEYYVPSELGGLVTELEKSRQIIQGIESDPYEDQPRWLKAGALSQEREFQGKLEKQLAEISHWENKLQA